MDTKSATNTSLITTRISAFWSIIIYIVALGAFLFMLEGLVLMIIPRTDEITIELLFISQVTVLFATLIATTFILRVVDHLPFSMLGLSLKGRGMSIFNGMAVAMVMYAVGFSVSCICGFVVVEGYALDWWVLFYSFIYYLCVSISEEVMCRGYILGRMLESGKINRYVALLISSSLFALLHLFNPNVTVLSFINLIMAGYMLGLVFLFTRNLWFAISLHLFWNWIQGSVLGYDVSGTKPMPGLLQISIPENNVWSGGMFGFEGSLVCTFCMLFFIVSVTIYFNKKAKQKNSAMALE